MFKRSLQWVFSNNHLRLWTLCAFLSFCAPVILGQQSNPQSPKSAPPDANEPNVKAADHKKSSDDVAEKLRKGLDSKNAAYAGSNIQVVVVEQKIILNGTVNSESQHEMALQLAQAYGSDRKVVDRLAVQQ